MMLRHTVLLAAALSLAACDDDEPTGITDPAFVRVINASPATTSLDVVVDGRLVESDLAFGESSDICVQVPSGDQTVTLRDDGATIAMVDATFVTGDRYALVLTGTAGADAEAVVVEDRPTPAVPGGFQFVRFVNATGETGQVYLTEPAEDIEDTPTFIVDPGEVTAFAQRPEEQTRTRFYAGTVSPPPGEVLADFTLDALPTSRTGTVVVTGEVEGFDATGFYVARCT